MKVKKIVLASVATLFVTLNLAAFDAASAAKDVYTKAKGNKTEKQWTRYFKNPKWQKKLGIDSLSDADRAALLEYLNKRSADKDQATVPQ